MFDVTGYLRDHKDRVFHAITLAGVMSASMAGIIWPYHRTLGIIMVVVCALCNGVLVLTVLSLCCAACVGHYIDQAETGGAARACKELSYCCCGCCWYCYEENFGSGEEARCLQEAASLSASSSCSQLAPPSQLPVVSVCHPGETEHAVRRTMSREQMLKDALDDLATTGNTKTPYYHLTQRGQDDPESQEQTNSRPHFCLSEQEDCKREEEDTECDLVVVDTQPESKLTVSSQHTTPEGKPAQGFIQGDLIEMNTSQQYSMQNKAISRARADAGVPATRI